VTEAFTTLGINPVSGVLYFLNRLSPLEAAHENWDIPIDQVQKKFLPDLSSSSDHAWGFWNRANVGGDLANINKIFACMITNAITLALIAEALRTYPLPPGVDESQRPRSVEKWPGTTFEMHYDAAQVLLGILAPSNAFCNLLSSVRGETIMLTTLSQGLQTVKLQAIFSLSTSTALVRARLSIV
jgi:hypothetical protein